MVAVGMPILCGATARTMTSASRPQLGAWGRSTCRVLASSATLPCGPGAAENAGGEQRRVSQILAMLTCYKYITTVTRLVSALRH